MKKYFLFIIFIITAGCSSAISSNKSESVIIQPNKFSDAVVSTTSVRNENNFVTTTESTIKMLFVGDIMLDRNVKKQINKNGDDYLLGELAKLNFFNNYDIVSGNLEGPFANFRRQTSKTIAFQFDPKLISMLKNYNFNLFNIANNHSLDMGALGLKESKNNLQAAGIDYYGDGYGLTASSTLIKEIQGIKIAFIGLNDTYFSLDKVKIKNILEESRKQADFVIVNIHWGQEYQFLKSNQHQQELAHLMVDAGADVIIGHHPHVIQEVEIYKDKLIFYSLGNFIFDQYFSTTTQQGLAVSLEIKNHKINYDLFPLQSFQSQVSLMAEEEKNNLLNKIYANRQSLSSTI